MSRQTPDISLTEFQKAVAVGSLLGDSSLTKPPAGTNFHLSCYHAIKQREWLVQKHTWLSPASRPIQWCAYLDKRDGKTREGGRFHTVSIPDFTAIAKELYPGGRKRIGSVFLSRFHHPASLACLICDDGSWDGGGIAIASKQFTVLENRRLADHLRRTFNLSITTQENGPYCYIRITAASVAAASSLCWDYVPKSLRYKFGPEGYTTRLVGMITRSCEGCGEPFRSYVSDGRRFCDVGCASTHRKSGYATRHKKRDCDSCGDPFVIYNCRQKLCAGCRAEARALGFHDLKTIKSLS